jgi:hypothetical protein
VGILEVEEEEGLLPVVHRGFADSMRMDGVRRIGMLVSKKMESGIVNTPVMISTVMMIQSRKTDMPQQPSTYMSMCLPYHAFIGIDTDIGTHAEKVSALSAAALSALLVLLLLLVRILLRLSTSILLIYSTRLYTTLLSLRC